MAGLREGALRRVSKFFQFHAVFEKKIGKIVYWHPMECLAPPPRGNPGSATGGLLTGGSHMWHGCMLQITFELHLNTVYKGKCDLRNKFSLLN